MTKYATEDEVVRWIEKMFRDRRLRCIHNNKVQDAESNGDNTMVIETCDGYPESLQVFEITVKEVQL